MSEYTVREEALEARPALVKRRRTPIAELGARLGEILPAVFAHATARGVTPTSPPFTRYLSMEGGELTFEAGIAVSAAGHAVDDIVEVTLPGGPAVVTDHVGPYEQLGAVPRALQAEQGCPGRGLGAAAAVPQQES